MRNDIVYFDISYEYIDEENNTTLRACLNETKYGYTYKVFSQDELFYYETHKHEKSEGLKMNLQKEASFDDIRILLIPFAHSLKKLIERQLSGSSEILS